MIDGVRATLAYSYPVSSSAPDQSIADIPAKAPLLMKRRSAFNPNSKAVMAPAATASLETLARCRIMSAIGTKQTSISTLNMSAFGGKADISNRLVDVR